MPEDQVIEKKVFEIGECKITDDEGKIYIKGYANTKGKTDAYGDRPDNFKGKAVYDLTLMKRNPVMMVDHQNSATMVMGNFVELEEDEKGLRFKALLRNPDTLSQPALKDVINGYKDGFIRALSIGGRWFFENPDDRNQLTKAIIHEISGVGIGADSFALTSVPKPKSAPKVEISKATKLEQIAELIGEYRANPSHEIIEKIKGVK